MLVKTTCRLEVTAFPVRYINELGGCVASIFTCSGTFHAIFRSYYVCLLRLPKEPRTKKEIMKPQVDAKFHFCSSAEQ